MHDVLTAEECERLIAASEEGGMGFHSGEGVVNVPRSMRTNDVCVFVAPTELVDELSRRLGPAVMKHLTMKENNDGLGAGSGTTTRISMQGSDDRHLRAPCFINRRFRVYRYKPPGRVGAGVGVNGVDGVDKDEDAAAAAAVLVPGQHFAPHHDGSGGEVGVSASVWRGRHTTQHKHNTRALASSLHSTLFQASHHHQMSETRVQHVYTTFKPRVFQDGCL